ncbi:MAG: PIN domain-containing protein [Eubacteriales bacterium]
MAIVDANYVLRYLLDDIGEQSRQAANIIENQNVKLPNEVVAEVVYVLQKVYNVERNDITESIKMLINYVNINVLNKDVVNVALEKYKVSKFDFVDCLLYAYSIIDGEQVYTFDKKLNKLIND